MAGGEVTYSTNAASPTVLRRAAPQRTRFGLYRAGVLVAPASATYELRSPSSVVVVAEDTATVAADGSLYYDLVALDLPATLAYGEGYVEIWTPTLTGPPEEVRTYRRAATLGRFELAPPLGEAELVAGAYPDLLLHAGGAFGGTFQPILDQAWGHVLRTLWGKGTPGTVVVDAGDLFDWYRELSLTRIFGALYAADANDRWRTLWTDHRDAERAARSALTLRIDLDHEGPAADLGRVSPATAVHVNAAPRRRLRPRWRTP